MGYKQLKKDELIKKLEETEKELANKRHLASTIRAKDKQISELKEANRKQISDLQTKHSKEIEKQKQNFSSSEADSGKKVKEHIEYLEGLLKKRNTQLNELLQTHGALLKTLQGITDNAISLNTYVYEKITGNKGGE